MKDLSKLIISIIAVAALATAMTSDLKAQVIGGLMMNKVYTTEEIVSVLGAPDTIRWDCYFFFEYTEDRPEQAASTQVTGEAGPYYARPKTDQIGFTREGEDRWYFYCYYIYTDRFDYNGKIRIGDHISKIREMDCYIREEKYDDSAKYAGVIHLGPEKDSGIDESRIEWMCCPTFRYDENGIIVEMVLYCD